MAVNGTMNTQTHDQTKGSETETRGNPRTYTLTPGEESVSALCNGYLESWNSSASELANVLASDVSPYDLAFAFLAATESLRDSLSTEPEMLPVFKHVLKSGYLELASAFVNFNNPLSNEYHRIFVKKRTESDPPTNFRVTPNRDELNTVLNDASVWTLAKLFHGQIVAGTGRCFPRRCQGLPLVSAGSVKNHEAHQKNHDDSRAKRPEPEYCVIENAAWNGKFVSDRLIDFLESIREPYNRVLKTGPDFSQAYKDAGALRRQNPEYQKQRSQNQRSGTQRQGTQRQGTQRQGTQRQGTQRQGTQRQGTQRQGGNQNSGNAQSNQQTMDLVVNQVVSKVLAQLTESGSTPVTNYWTAQRPSGPWGQRQEIQEQQDQRQEVQELQDQGQEDQGQEDQRQQVQDLDQNQAQVQVQQTELVDQDGFQVVVKRSNRPKKNVKNTQNSRARIVNQS
jgi:hypothetical protein